MSRSALTKSQCEETANYNAQPVERHIPTYCEVIRKTYGAAVYERAYMHTDDDLDAARRYLEAIAAGTEDPDGIKAIYTARACIREEQRRRNRK